MSKHNNTQNEWDDFLPPWEWDLPEWDLPEWEEPETWELSLPEWDF